MWGMEDHGGLDLTETETETDLTPAGYKATTGYPSHNANHRTTGSIMPPCLDPVQGRCPQSPDSPGATGILYGRLLEGGFLLCLLETSSAVSPATSDGESDDENIFEGGETAEIRENKKLHVYTSPRGFGF